MAFDNIGTTQGEVLEDIAPGTVVRFRGRVWRVDSVENGTFAATPLDGRDLRSRSFATALESPASAAISFPDPADIGDPADQDLLLRAYRLALVHGSAPIVGLQRSRAIPTPFQLVPLLMSMGREQVRMLIADDVGLGKTIEAGLILAELVARARVRRVLVVCPWNLCEQWQDALEHFFHLDGTIVASHLMPALERSLLPGQSAWEAHDICIASVDYLKIHPEVLQHQWDLAVIDEAHLCSRAPSSSTGTSEKLRWTFAERLSQVVEHLLLLTATPHSGRTESFASLLELINPDLVSQRGDRIEIDRANAREHVCQRRRRDVEEWQGEDSPFPDRDQREIVVEVSKPYARLLEELREYTDELDDTARSESRPLNAWVAAHLQKRALSSPHALRISIARRLRRLREQPPDEATDADLDEARTEVADEAGGEGLSDAERVQRVDLSPASLSKEREIEYLERVSESAKKVAPARDSKLKRLRELIPQRAAMHAQARRVIVFTKYRDTLDYVVKNLKPTGFELFEIHGELSAGERARRFADFAATAKAVLIATDCISEGLNLQHAAAEIIHYELPWNPNRLEQRNGRVDRFGQPEASVGIRTLVLDDALDMAILERCVRRAQEIRRELGYAPPFFAGGETIRSLVQRYGRSRQASLFETGDQVEDFFDPELQQRLEGESFFGQIDVELGDVRGIVEDSRAITGSPERVREFVALAVQIHGMSLAEAGSETFELQGTAPELADSFDPDRPLVFDPRVLTAVPGADVVDLAHPLLRALVESVQDRALGGKGPGRVCGYPTAETSDVVGLFHVLARFVTDSHPPVVLEELIPIAFEAFGAGPALEEAECLVGAPPARGAVISSDITEAAREVLGQSELREQIDATVEDVAREIGSRHRSLGTSWAAGLSDVAVASWDPIAMNMLFPAGPRSG